MAYDPNDPLAYIDASVPGLALPYDQWADAFYREHFGQQPPVVDPGAIAVPTAGTSVPGIFPPVAPGPVPAPPPAPAPPPPPPPPPSSIGPAPTPGVAPTAEHPLPTGLEATPAPPPVPDLPSEPPPPELDFGVTPENDLSQHGSLPEHIFDAAKQGMVNDQSAEQLSNKYVNDPYKFRLDQQRRDEHQAALERPVVADLARQQADADQMHADAMAKANAKTEQLNRDAEMMASDQTWFDRQGTGVKFAGYLAAAIAGFLNPTGPNSVVQLIKDANEGDVRRRMSAINAGREGVVASVEGAKSAREAAYTMLQANYTKAVQSIDAEMAKYDPVGAKAMSLAATKSALIGEMQEAARQAHKDQLKDALDLAELDLKGAQAAKASAEAGIAARKAAGIGMGGGGGISIAPMGVAGQGDRKDALTADQWRARGLVALPGDADRAAGYTEKELKGWQAIAKSDKDTSANTFGNVLQPPDKDGKRVPFVAVGDPTTVSQAKAQYLASRTIIRDIDKILSVRRGWTSDWAASDENLEIRSALKEATVTMAQLFKLGAISKDDAGHIEGFLTGGLDPTGFRNAKAALLAARQSIVDETTASMQGVGYKGDLSDPNDPNHIPPPPKDIGRVESTKEQAFSEIVQQGDTATTAPMIKRLGDIAAGVTTDDGIDPDTALAQLKQFADHGGSEVGQYAKDLITAAQLPHLKEQWEAKQVEKVKMGGKRDPEFAPAGAFMTPYNLDALVSPRIRAFEKAHGIGGD